jgi:hypothetical protein
MSRDKVTKGGILIKHDEDKDVSSLRGRDVEFMLRDASVDPRVKRVLVGLAEANHANTNRVAGMATLVDQCVDIVTNFAQIAGNMKDAVGILQRQVAGETPPEVGGADDTTEH